MNPRFLIPSGRGGGKAYSAECFGYFLMRQKELDSKKEAMQR